MIGPVNPQSNRAPQPLDRLGINFRLLAGRRGSQDAGQNPFAEA